MIRFQRIKPFRSELNIAPLIDIVFLLLIFFLLTSSFVHPGLELSLPEAESAEIQESEEDTIWITASGDLFLNQERLSWEELPERLAAAIASDPEKAIVVKADEKVPFRWFVRAMDISKGAGVVNLTISAERPRELPQPVSPPR